MNSLNFLFLGNRINALGESIWKMVISVSKMVRQYKFRSITIWINLKSYSQT